MTLEHFVAAWIVGTVIVSAFCLTVAGVALANLIMEDVDARERRRRGYRPDAGLDGAEEARAEDPARAAASRVYRETGWMSATTRRYG